jgi:hypothetical protein
VRVVPQAHIVRVSDGQSHIDFPPWLFNLTTPLGIIQMPQCDPAAIMVEAKSHVAEIYGDGCKAENENSLRLIERSISAVKAYLGVPDNADWVGPLYQYTNRLSHLYFCQHVIKRPAWPINVYFINDPFKPTSEHEWKVALPTVKSAAGVAA